MRFAVDAHAIGRHLTGNEVYVRSLLREFGEMDRTSEFIACISEPEAERWLPQRFDIRRVSADPFRRLGWDLRRAVKAARADILHVQYTAPVGVRVPVIVTVHDVSFLEHPEFFTLPRRSQLRFTVKRTVKTSSGIITVSEFSRRAILRYYDVSPDKVHVIPNAANPYFRVTNRDRARCVVRNRLRLDAPFVLSVGDLQPRKNHIRLIEAFARLLSTHPKLTHHLLLTGKDTWFGEKVRNAAESSGVASRIHFTGFVDDSELLDLYNACDCFVFPSRGGLLTNIGDSGSGGWRLSAFRSGGCARNHAGHGRPSPRGRAAHAHGAPGAAKRRAVQLAFQRFGYSGRL
jgi:glycosyltransferase involved in cell wall biosynthesis